MQATCIHLNMRYIKLLSIALLVSTSLTAQLDSVFVRNYGGPGNEPLGFGTGQSGAPHVRSAIDENGNVYIASFTNSATGDIPSNAGLDDVFVVKTSPDGDILWSQTYGGEGTDRCYSIQILNNGNIAVTGRTASNQGLFDGAIGLEDGFVLIVNPDGDVQSFLRYGGSQVETIYDLVELDNGDFIACGIAGSIDGDINDNTFVGSNKAWVFRANANGEIIWSRITNGLINNPDWEESFWNVELNNAKDAVYLLGASYNFNDINSDDLLLCKYNLDGELQLKQTFGGGAGDSPSGLYVGLSNEVFALGTIRGGGGDVTEYFAGNADAWMLKLDSNLNYVCDRSYGGANLDYAYGLNQYTSESLFISMASRSTDETASKESFGLMDGLLVEVSTQNGDTLQTLRWGSMGSDYSHDIALVSEGEFYAVGRSDGSDGWISGAKGASDLVMIHYRDLELGEPLKQAKTQFKVYPNPSRNTISLLLEENDYTLHIYNVQGEWIKSVHSSAITNALDVSFLNAGVYLLEIVPQNSDKIKHQRLVIN